MKTAIACLFFVILARTASAQVYVHPTDLGAVLLDQFWTTYAVDGVQSHAAVTVWQLSGGGTDYVFDVESLQFSTNCSNINNASLGEIVEAGTDAAIVDGVARGYPACASTPFAKDIRIWTASCASRSGSGCSTEFFACSSDWSYRTYGVYCPGNASPTITQKSGSSCSCSGSCEESCGP